MRVGFIITACAAWFALELVAYQSWKRAGPRQRLAVLTVRLVHAVVATLLSGRVLMDAGFGMGGAFDRNPCSALPESDVAIEISLAWGLWEIASVVRALDEEGALMLLHASIFVSSQCIVLGFGYMRHFMVSMLLTELTEILYSLRMLLLTLHGRSFRDTAAFRFLRDAFVWTYPCVRIIYAACRSVVHLRALLEYSVRTRPWSGRVTPLDSPSCGNGLVMLADACGTVLQMALNLWWGAQVVSKVFRGTRRPVVKT
jgi:hypothetical protein